MIRWRVEVHYTTWKVDGATPMYWFISLSFAPYKSPPFWELRHLFSPQTVYLARFSRMAEPYPTCSPNERLLAFFVGQGQMGCPLVQTLQPTRLALDHLPTLVLPHILLQATSAKAVSSIFTSTATVWIKYHDLFVSKKMELNRNLPSTSWSLIKLRYTVTWYIHLVILSHPVRLSNYPTNSLSLYMSNLRCDFPCHWKAVPALLVLRLFGTFWRTWRAWFWQEMKGMKRSV